MQNRALGQETDTISLLLSDLGADQVPALPAAEPAVAGAELALETSGDASFAVLGALGTAAALETVGLGDPDEAGESPCVTVAPTMSAATMTPATDRIAVRRPWLGLAGNSRSQTQRGGSGLRGLIDVISTLLSLSHARYRTQ
jgi:hypothetical protein